MHLLLVAVALWRKQHYSVLLFFPSVLGKNTLFIFLDSVITELHYIRNRLKYTEIQSWHVTMDSAWPSVPHVSGNNTKSKMHWPCQHMLLQQQRTSVDRALKSPQRKLFVKPCENSDKSWLKQHIFRTNTWMGCIFFDCAFHFKVLSKSGQRTLSIYIHRKTPLRGKVEPLKHSTAKCCYRQKAGFFFLRT